MSSLLIPGLAIPVAGLAQNTASNPGTTSVFDPVRLPDEAPKTTESNSLIPWWQTNQPPSNLISGPQFGTDVIGALAPGLNSVPPPLMRPPTSGVPEALRWGPVTAHPHVNYGVSYGNGLISGPDREEYTFVNTLSPGVLLELGKNWRFDYTPSLVFYTADAYQNTVNQNVSLNGTASQGDWSFGFGDNFSMTDNPLVETGTQTQQTANTTQLSASRPLSPVLSLNLGASQALRWAEAYNNTFSWSTLNGLDYRIRPNVTVGADIGFGYDLVNPGTNMSSERLQLSVSGLIGERISYNFSGGFEIRQFIGTDAEMKLSPILNLVLNYAITEKTQLNVYGNRQVTPSYYDNQFTESAALGGGVTQRIFGRFYLSLTGGYRWSDNNSSFDPTFTVQTNDYAFAQVGISSRFLQRGTASLFYMWSNNNSNSQLLAYTSNQYGLQLGYGW